MFLESTDGTEVKDQSSLDRDVLGIGTLLALQYVCRLVLNSQPLANHFGPFIHQEKYHPKYTDHPD